MRPKEPYSFAQALSDGLSLITIGLCLVGKVPQILRLVGVKSALGLNLLALGLELASYSVMLAYNYRSNYALLSYLEYPILLVQQWVLIYLVLLYQRQLGARSLATAAVYFALLAGCLQGYIPREVISVLVPFCTPIGCSSKVVQLAELFRTKNSESVSILTWFISAFTNMTRIYTIYMDSADAALLLNFCVNSLLSSSIMAAAYYFKPKRLEVQKRVE